MKSFLGVNTTINFNIRMLVKTIASLLETVGDLILTIFDSVEFLFSTLFFRHFFLSLLSYLAPSYDTGDTEFFSDDESEDFFGEHRGGNKFLGKYSVKDAEAILRMSPLITKLNSDIPDWYVEFDLSDCFSHYGYIRSRSITEKEKYYAFIIVHVGDFALEKPYLKGKGADIIRRYLPRNINLLNVKWFSLQNPKENFTKERPRLPGQKFPGTGAGRMALQLLTTLAMKNGRDGIVNNPEHFHNAYMYTGFMFLNPTQEGWFRRMVSDLSEDIKTRGLAIVSWAIYLGHGRENGEKIEWNLHEQVLPLSMRATKYFYKREYRNEVARSMQSAGPFTIDWEAAKTNGLSTAISC